MARYTPPDVAGHAVNRRIRTTQGVRPPHASVLPDTVIGPEGPDDGSVHAEAFVDGADKPIGVLVNAACHPVHEMCIPRVSPDFPGELCIELERLHPGTTTLFLQGSAGNMNPPTVSGGPDNARRHGQRLAEAVREALGGLRPVGGDELAIRWRRVAMPARDEEGRPRPTPLKTKIAAVRVGDAALLFMPGESFIETSLAIRAVSPWGFIMVVGYAEEWIGYVPTDRAFDNGGYEVGPGTWSKVGRGSEPILRNAAVALLSDAALQTPPAAMP